jgi:hypothetical protein
MDTKPLERFATQSRRDLLAAVDARATSVLATGSVARAERPDVVRKLEAEIAVHGRAHVVDKIAYTWFNRIVALRFMDARGYTDAGIVSPAPGQAHGQPEILVEAKRGNLDGDVVIDKHTAASIISLLDGSRRSTDAEGEAYALLLTDYCRSWHKSMPFMFEREGDYAELLVPTGLLADGAILSRAREVLTDEVCDDVEVIGWLYQFYIAEQKELVFAGFKKNKKAGADEIPAATQLFTPHWIVRYLVENSVGRLWMLNRPTSRLIDRMEYYIAPVGDDTDFPTIARPEDLTVIDPACGSGHMLTYAFDLLYAIYEEDGYAPSEIPSLILRHNIRGTEIDPRAGSLAAFALTMKARAKHRAFFGGHTMPEICVIGPISFSSDEIDLLLTHSLQRDVEVAFWRQFEDADLYGALIRPDPVTTASVEQHLATLADDRDLVLSDVLSRAAEVVAQAKVLSGSYTTIVANPPYMGVKNMSPALSSFIESTIPGGKQDLYGAFVARSIGLAARFGQIAMITGDTWMFIKTFEDLRTVVLDTTRVHSLIHLRDSAYHADKFGANSAFVLTHSSFTANDGVFIRLTALDGEEKRRSLISAIQEPDANHRYAFAASDFKKIPGSPLAFTLSSEELSAFTRGVRLGSVAEPRQGMATSDNDRFLRYAHEVSRGRIAFRSESREHARQSGAKWFPYRKGGERRRWYGNHEYVVNWENDGAELFAFRPRSVIRNPGTYFREALTWSLTSANGFAARYCPPGFLYDVNGMSSFATDGLLEILGTVNSTVGAELLAAVNPTLAFQVGDIAAFPYLAPKQGAEFARLVDECIEIARADWDSQETSWDFSELPLLRLKRPQSTVADAIEQTCEHWAAQARTLSERETELNEECRRTYSLADDVVTSVRPSDLTLINNPSVDSTRVAADYRRTEVERLISFAVGCMFGRFSLDRPGLILADQGAGVQDYLDQVPSPTFRPDADNVIPIVDDGWFEDDIVDRFRQFLLVTFGRDRFDENLRYIEESLGVVTLRDYFISKSGKSKFYEDHIKRYKSRPIYWMFSSPDGSFNALVYMHRYSPSTVSTVLNEYLREYQAKLELALTSAERASAADSRKDQNEADRIRGVLAELDYYEHDVLYPLATRRLTIDLDDGVLLNYLRLEPALRPFGLGKTRSKVEGWRWPTNCLEAAE